MNLLQRWFGAKRPSPPSLVPARESRHPSFAVGALTDKGTVRERNEDALLTLDVTISQEEELLPTGLYIVADGMGGHEGGDQASALAVRLVANWVLGRIYRPYLLNTDQSDEGRQPINQVLTEAFAVANSKVREVYPNGGTTLTSVFILGRNAFFAHVGDSRAYLVGQNTIRQITTDHSLVNRLIELGQLTRREAKTHPQRNVLYRALGRADNLEVDTHLQSLPANSSLLLCSDGLWGVVPERDILSTINAASSPQAACHYLIAQANENGGEDNVTAVIIQIQD